MYSWKNYATVEINPNPNHDSQCAYSYYKEIFCVNIIRCPNWTNWNFWLGQISHVILSDFILGGRGIGGGVRENNPYCFLLRMANLLTFIHNGI